MRGGVSFLFDLKKIYFFRFNLVRFNEVCAFDGSVGLCLFLTEAED